MTIIQKNALGLPQFGNRSNLYFGINLNMSREWFNETSSECRTNKTPHPTAIPLRQYESQQMALRDVFFQSPVMDEMSPDEKKTEWKNVVLAATEHCTQEFINSGTWLQASFAELPFIPRHIDALLDAAQSAFIHMERLVKERIGRNGTKKLVLKPNMCLLLDFRDKDQDKIYVEWHVNHCDEHLHAPRKAYKIGHTNNLEQRGKTHRGSNTALRRVSVLYTRGIVTEKAIHNLFKRQKMSGTREWFWLGVEDLAILKSQERLKRLLEESFNGVEQ